MDTIKQRFKNLTLPSTFVRSWSSAIALWILTLGYLALSSAEAQDMYVDQVVPSQVTVGEVFTIEGQFPGMTSAAVFLSDGIYGLPLTVLSVTDQEISARVDAIPWPMTGTLHVMNRQGVQEIPSQTWQGDGVTIDVIGGIQFESTQASAGGVLTVVGAAPANPPQVFAAFEGGLRLTPQDPCSGSTVLIQIEPDLTAPRERDEGCEGFGTELVIYCEDLNMPVANFYNTMAAGLHQLISAHGFQVSFDSNSHSSGHGTLLIEQVVDCPSRVGTAALLGD